MHFIYRILPQQSWRTVCYPQILSSLMWSDLGPWLSIFDEQIPILETETMATCIREQLVGINIGIAAMS